MATNASQAARSRLATGPDRPIATAIRIARRQAELTQSEAADQLDVKQSSVSQWERGVTEPTGERLLLLMAVLPALPDALKAQAACLVAAPPAAGAATTEKPAGWSGTTATQHPDMDPGQEPATFW